MKKLIIVIGLVLVMCLLVPVSCTCSPVATESEVEDEEVTPAEEEPALTEEREKELAEKGIWNVDTVEEASKITGYPVATPAFIPEGFHRGSKIMWITVNVES